MNKAQIPMGKFVILLVCAIAVMATTFATIGSAYGDEQPPEGARDAPDITDPQVVEEWRDRLIAAILDGDGRPVWDELTPEAQTVVANAVMDAITYVPVTEETPSTSSDSGNADGSSGCDTHTYGFLARLAPDINLWKYTSSTYWFWDGTQITKTPHVTRAGYVYQDFIKFVGHTTTLESGGKGELSHYDHMQGHFKSCLTPAKVICPFDANPTVSKQQFYDGDTWHDATGG